VLPPRQSSPAASVIPNPVRGFGVPNPASDPVVPNAAPKSAASNIAAGRGAANVTAPGPVAPNLKSLSVDPFDRLKFDRRLQRLRSSRGGPNQPHDAQVDGKYESTKIKAR
jgi:hypothetical protein